MKKKEKEEILFDIIPRVFKDMNIKTVGTCFVQAIVNSCSFG